MHEKNQFLDLSGRMGHEIKKGEKVSSQINIHEVHQIEKHYHDPHDTHGRTKEAADRFHTVCTEMNYDACIYRELTKIMIDQTEAKCTVPWFPSNYSMEQINSHRVCTEEKDINTSFNIYSTRLTNQHNDCNKPCQSVILNIGGKNYNYDESKTSGVAMFYFSMTSTKTTENYLYSFTSLVAEIGGYLGLLLGYSCLDFVSAVRNLGETRPWRRITTQTVPQ